MKYLIFSLAFLSAACAHSVEPTPASQRNKERAQNERAEDAVKHMQDEFNQLYGNGEN